MPEIERRHSRYAPNSVQIGIVHIGLGAFHRAHQAAYLEHWLNRNNGGDWGICAANIRSNSQLVRQLQARDCRYHIAEFADREHVRLTEIGSIRRVLFARDEARELLEQMTTPATKIVSLTVTEKGYYLNPATGQVLFDDPAIAHDLDRPHAPRTAPGFVLEALRRRRTLGIAPFTVLCCDNMPANGERTRRAVCGLASRVSEDLASWIESDVAFPSTMVDRIVPALTPEMAGRLEELIGHADPAAVACEAFSQWVIEDRFPMGRPDWEADGVEMVDDVVPYETMKLRLLNGAHSLLAYVGLLDGLSTVAAAIAEPGLAALVTGYFDEAGATLTAGPSEQAIYREALLARFRNDALDHQLRQIAMDGSQKIPQRWLDGVWINLERGRPVRATAHAVAAWMRYVRGSDGRGRQWQVDDPLASTLADCHRKHTNAREIASALLSIRSVFPEPLAQHEGFRHAVLAAFEQIVSSEA
jgi:fructuronate reductase